MQTSDIKGKVVVLTGKFSKVKRAEAEAALVRLGATIDGSVGKTTDILFVGERAGSKLAKAKSLGVTIVDEAALETLLAAAPGADDSQHSEPEVAEVIEQTPVTGLAGKTVALTGTFTTMKRADAQKLLREAGATVGSGVTKATEVLIYGDNAGSKLDKATSAGIALMTEAEMVALLTAGGAGKEQLAGAQEKLADKQAKASASATEMTAVAAELRAFVQLLKKRKDITVEHATLGRKAGKAKLAELEATGIPAELIEFYAEMDGIHVAWRFIEPAGSGCLRVPPANQWTRFGGDDDHYMGFGEDREALLLDEVTPEGNTWLVRTKGPKGKRAKGDCTIIFASAAEGDDGVIAAGSIAQYLREAMRNGFVSYWPRCFKPSPNVSYAESEQQIERFQAAPVAPSPIRAGRRVQFQFFSEGGRGEVLAVQDALPGRLADFTGPQLAQVKLDEGTVAWLPNKFIKVHTKPDAYERLRDPSFDLAGAIEGDLAGLLDEFPRALDSVCNKGRRAAGLLSTRSFPDAVRFVLELDEAIIAAGLELNAKRVLTKSGDEFSPSELARYRWAYDLTNVLIGLYHGLYILAAHESARRGVPGTALLDAELRTRLAGVAKDETERSARQAALLVERCASKEPLVPPSWSVGPEDQAENLGLPAGALVFVGTGF